MPPFENLPTVQLTEEQRRTKAIEDINKYRVSEQDPDDPSKSISTNVLRPELTGGQIPENVDIDQLIQSGSLSDIEQLSTGLTNRERAREEGYLGEFGTGGYERFRKTAGVTAGDVDPYGKQTTQGYLRGQIEDPRLPKGAELQPVLYETRPDEFIEQKFDIDPRSAEAELTTAPTAVQAQVAPKLQASSFQAATVAPQVAQQDVTVATQAEVRDPVQAQQEQVQALSTVQGQLAQLYSQFDADDPPPFAAGAIRVCLLYTSDAADE